MAESRLDSVLRSWGEAAVLTVGSLPGELLEVEAISASDGDV